MIRLSPDRKYIEITVSVDYVYDIAVEIFKDRDDIDRWKNHLSEKQWATPEMMREFERLALSAVKR